VVADAEPKSAVSSSEVMADDAAETEFIRVLETTFDRLIFEVGTTRDVGAFTDCTVAVDTGTSDEREDETDSFDIINSILSIDTSTDGVGAPDCL